MSAELHQGTVVFIAHHDPDLRGLLAENLNDEGFSMVQTSPLSPKNGDFLESARTSIQDPRIVSIFLVDISKGRGRENSVQDGKDLIEEVRRLASQAGRKVPVGILTTYSKPHNIEPLQAIADKVLQKPFGMDEFISTVRDLERRAVAVLGVDSSSL